MKHALLSPISELLCAYKHLRHLNGPSDTRVSVCRADLVVMFSKSGLITDVAEPSNDERYFRFAPRGHNRIFVTPVKNLDTLNSSVREAYELYDLTGLEKTFPVLKSYRLAVEQLDVSRIGTTPKQNVAFDCSWASSRLHDADFAAAFIDWIQKQSTDTTRDRFGGSGYIKTAKLGSVPRLGLVNLVSCDVEQNPSQRRYTFDGQEQHLIAKSTFDRCKAALDYMMTEPAPKREGDSFTRFIHSFRRDDFLLLSYVQNGTTRAAQTASQVTLNAISDDSSMELRDEAYTSQSHATARQDALSLQKDQFSGEIRLVGFKLKRKGPTAFPATFYTADVTGKELASAIDRWRAAVGQAKSFDPFREIRQQAPLSLWWSIYKSGELQVPSPDPIISAFFDPADAGALADRVFTDQESKILAYASRLSSDGRPALQLVSILHALEKDMTNIDSPCFNCGVAMRECVNMHQRYHRELHNDSIDRSPAHEMIGRIVHRTSEFGDFCINFMPIIQWAEKYHRAAAYAFRVAVSKAINLPEHPNRKERQEIVLGFMYRPERKSNETTETEAVEPAEK